MSTVSPLKISDRLVSFAQQTQSERLSGSLKALAVFHQDFAADIQAHEQQQGNEHAGKTYEDGLAEGLAQGQRSVQTQGQSSAELLTALQGGIMALGQDIQASHSRAVAAALRAVLPMLGEQAAGAEIVTFLAKIAGQALHGKVTLIVNPNFEKEVETMVQTLASEHYEALSFSIQTDEAVVGRALKAVWQGGGGDIDIETAVSSCLALLDAELT